MKILIPTIGSRGDVQPFIALAQGLTRAGHITTLASHPVMKNLVESHGVAFAPIGPDINIAQKSADIRRQAWNAAAGLIQVMGFGFAMLEQSHDDIMALCQKADLVIVPAAVAAGKNEAELLQLPYISVTLMPWAIPWQDPGRPIIKRILYGAIDSLVHLITTRPLNRIRKKIGLPPVGDEGFTSPLLNLIPISPAVYPPNPLWESRHRTVGYWFVDEPLGWVPPAELVAFLDSGDPPYVITLGAMSLGNGEASESAGLFLDAVQEIGVRAIIQGWETVIGNLSLPTTIFTTGSIPHSWLFHRCAGIIHHGGFGTTAAGLRAGLPALVIPHIADQFYWGQQIHELGVGPQPIRRAKLDKKGLVDALDELARNKTLQESAFTLGEHIRSEAGISEAVGLIQETLV
jgi:UDP:flavonoid glycosyltransferase YjiC (YdhE family)